MCRVLRILNIRWKGVTWSVHGRKTAAGRRVRLSIYGRRDGAELGRRGCVEWPGSVHRDRDPERCPPQLLFESSAEPRTPAASTRNRSYYSPIISLSLSTWAPLGVTGVAKRLFYHVCLTRSRRPNRLGYGY